MERKYWTEGQRRSHAQRTLSSASSLSHSELGFQQHLQGCADRADPTHREGLTTVESEAGCLSEARNTRHPMPAGLGQCLISLR